MTNRELRRKLKDLNLQRIEATKEINRRCHKADKLRLEKLRECMSGAGLNDLWYIKSLFRSNSDDIIAIYDRSTQS